MTQAVLPQLRLRKAGVIINITSKVTLKSLTLLSVYTASKAAINAFSESLALELKPFNVRVSLVIPGRAPTPFADNAKTRMHGSISEPYASFAQNIFAAMSQPSAGTRPIDVAEAVWRAATDPSCPMRIAAGADAVALAASS